MWWRVSQRCSPWLCVQLFWYGDWPALCSPGCALGTAVLEGKKLGGSNIAGEKLASDALSTSASGEPARCRGWTAYVTPASAKSWWSISRSSWLSSAKQSLKVAESWASSGYSHSSLANKSSAKQGRGRCLTAFSMTSCSGNAGILFPAAQPTQHGSQPSNWKLGGQDINQIHFNIIFITSVIFF